MAKSTAYYAAYTLNVNTPLSGRGMSFCFIVGTVLFANTMELFQLK